MGFEDIKSEEENPRGYKPLELDYHGGHLWLPNGVRFEPDFPVGSERWQIDLFIEYERTFGRGKAFEITHQITEESQNPEMIEKYGGYNMISDAHSLMYHLPKFIEGIYGESKDIPKLIEKLRIFRLNYPLLYEDAEQHPNAGHVY